MTSTDRYLLMYRFGRNSEGCRLLCDEPHHLAAPCPAAVGAGDHGWCVFDLVERSDLAVGELGFNHSYELVMGESQELRTFFYAINELRIRLVLYQCPQVFNIEPSMWDSEEEETNA